MTKKPGGYVLSFEDGEFVFRDVKPLKPKKKSKRRWPARKMRRGEFKKIMGMLKPVDENNPR